MYRPFRFTLDDFQSSLSRPIVISSYAWLVKCSSLIRCPWIGLIFNPVCLFQFESMNAILQNEVDYFVYDIKAALPQFIQFSLIPRFLTFTISQCYNTDWCHASFICAFTHCLSLTASTSKDDFYEFLRLVVLEGYCPSRSVSGSLLSLVIGSHLPVADLLHRLLA